MGEATNTHPETPHVKEAQRLFLQIVDREFLGEVEFQAHRRILKYVGHLKQFEV